MNEQSRIIDSGRAKEVVDNPAYQKVFNDIKMRTVDALSDAGLKDDDLIIRLKITLELLEQLKKGFDRSLNDGKVAQVTLQRNKLSTKRL